jgi:hypothetical protein
MPAKKTFNVPFTRRYYFARGYHDRIIKVDNPPSSEVNEYYIQELDINVIEEYNKGREIAERDLVNGLV